MAEKRTINIDINSNASEAEKDFKSFNKAVDETTKSAKNLDATFEEVYGDLQPLTTRMGEAEDRLYELALAGKSTSKEYQELLTKVGEYRKVQIQTDLAVDGAATTMTQKLGSALNGATSGFAATQGAMALFGDENQALEESLLKVQSALAIQQGVQGLTEAYRELSIGTKIAGAAQAAFTFVTGGATTGLKLFRLALISTGVGALVVGLGLLIANFEKIQEVLSDVNKGFKDGNLVTKALMIAFAPLILTIKAATKGLQMLGVIASEEDKKADAIHKAKMDRYLEESKALSEQSEDIKRASRARQKALDDEIEMLEAQGKKTRDIQRQKLEDNILLAKQEAEIAEKQAKLAEKNNAFTKKTQRLLFEARTRFVEENERKLRVFDAQTNTERISNYKDYAKERISIARQIEDIENGLLEDGIEKELEINRDKFRRLREDAKKNTKLTRTERARLIELFDEQELAQQKVIDAKYEKIRQDKIDKEKAELQELVDFNEELRLKEIEDNKAKNLQIIEDNKAAAAKQKEIDEKAKADAQAIQDFKFDIASQGLQTISNLTELFAGKSEKAAKKAFQVQKAVSIAQATIDTYKSANAIFASTAANPITVLNPSAPFIAAGVAVAAGLVNVASIASQKFQGGGSTGGGGQESAPDLGGGATPQFNVVGDSGINQIAQLQQQPVQAFVVSGEVTTSQALDRNRVQNATL